MKNYRKFNENEKKKKKKKKKKKTGSTALERSVISYRGLKQALRYSNPHIQLP